MAIEFARRPVLAGKNLKHPTNARVRGDVRRSDADGTSAVPYFPLVSASQTLIIATQGGTATVTLSSNALSGILSDINLALGANGNAFSEDGCIGIQTSQTGDGGFVSVTGGTASTGLGFNTYGGVLPIQGRTSDVSVAPEGRVGNPYGTVFPGKEDLTSDTLNRNFGRLSANDDILWADSVKNTAVTKVVTHTPSPDGSYTTLSLTQKVLVSGQGLSAASTKKDLVPYFQLIDSTTGLPAQSQVVAVVRGVPVGEPLYANSPSWTDTTGKNVLGLDQTKIVSTAITTIKNGRIVNCAGASFITSNVAVGDWAEIASATNLSPSSNNGYRWVVEKVLTETDLILRPMSGGEIQYLGLSFGSTAVELNDNKTGGESYGNLIVRTGPFASRVNLVLRPPIPAGATYELRATVPSSLHDDAPGDRQFSAASSMADLASVYSPTFNGTISGLDASWAVGNCLISTGLIRWHGRIYSIPTTTLLPSAFAVGSNYVYWDDTTTSLKVTQDPATFVSVYNESVTTNKGHVLCFVQKTGAILTNVTPIKRTISEAGRAITVGIGGQFLYLEDALNYIALSSIGTSETPTGTASGGYPHVEIVLLSDVTFDITGAHFTTSILTSPSVTIRGSSPSVKLTCNAIVMTGCTHLEIRDLTLAAYGAISGFICGGVVGAETTVVIDNVTQVSGAYQTVVYGGPGVRMTNVRITNSKFIVSQGIITTDFLSGDPGRIVLENSTFTFNGASPTPTMFKDILSPTWSGNFLTIRDCSFDSLGTGWVTTSSTLPLAVGMVGTVVVENSRFSLGNHTSASQAVLFNIPDTSSALFSNVWCGGRIPSFVLGNGLTKVSHCEMTVNVDEGAPDGFYGVLANQVLFSKIGAGTQDVGVQSGIAVSTALAPDPDTSNVPLVDGNFIYGNFKVLVAAGSYSIVRNNYLDTGEATTAFSENAILVGGNDVAVSGNSIYVSSPTKSCTAIGTLLGSVRTSIVDNHITIQPPTGVAAVLTGVEIVGNDSKIERNVVVMAAGTPVGANNVIGLIVDGTARNTIANNTIELPAVSGRTWTGLQMNAATYTVVSSNLLSVFGSPLVNNAPSLTNNIHGNLFNALSDVLTSVSNLGGTVTDNVFSHTGAGILAATLSVGGTYSGNRFETVTLTNNAQPVSFTGNTFVNNLNSSSGNSTYFSFSGNVFLASVTFTSGAPARFDSCSFAATTNISCAGMQVSNCKFDGAPTLTDNSSDASIYSNCIFTGRLTLNGTGPAQTVTGCKFSDGITMSQDVSFVFTNNYVFCSGISAAALSLPSMASPRKLSITNNKFVIGTVGGTAPTYGGIYVSMAGGMTLANNTIVIDETATSTPGGSGTVSVYAVSVYAGANPLNRAMIIGGNHIRIPTNNTWGARTNEYYFFELYGPQEITGSGNLLDREGISPIPGVNPVYRGASWTFSTSDMGHVIMS